jgi:hypothetical protein
LSTRLIVFLIAIDNPFHGKPAQSLK